MKNVMKFVPPLVVLLVIVIIAIRPLVMGKGHKDELPTGEVTAEE